MRGGLRAAGRRRGGRAGVRVAGWVLLAVWCRAAMGLQVIEETDAGQPGLRRATGASAAAIASGMQAQRFLRGRARPGVAPAIALGQARMEHAEVLARGVVSPQTVTLNAGWTPVGPMQVTSPIYGSVTGRVTSVAIDPNDVSGNTVYVGTTGGGVWKSVNAAGDPARVTFVPLTDVLPVFSANAGTTALPSLSIGALAVQGGGAGGVILAGTGDSNDALDSYYGGGILRSADGGLTWTLIQNSNDQTAGQHSFVGLSVAGLAWSSVSPNLAVAALSQSIEGLLVNAGNATYSAKGLYYSTDAGVTWQMATVLDGSQVVQRPLPGGANVSVSTIAVVWNPVRQRFYAALRFHGYYESADGMTWTRLLHQPGTGLTQGACPTLRSSTGCPIYRGALAVQPVSGDMFALTVDYSDLDQGLWQDVCGISGTGCSSNTVAFGTRLSSTALEIGNGSTAIASGSYNLVLGAAAAATGTSSTDTLLFVGTTDVYRCSIAAGCVLRNTTNARNGCAAPAKVAAAQHAIATLGGGAQPLVYVGNDGGLWRSTDGIAQTGPACSATDADHFQNLNGGLGSLAEPISFAQDPIDPGSLLVGLGSGGTAGTGAGAGAAAWAQLSAGEGGTVAIDPTRPSLWYLSGAPGVDIHPCGNGSGCTVSDFSGPPAIGTAQVARDAAATDAPWILDPAAPASVLIGTCRVWRGPASSGAGWSSSNVISRMLGGSQAPSCVSTNGVIRSMAAGGSATGAASAQGAGSSVIYVGMAGVVDGGGSMGGHLFSTTSAGTATSSTAWRDLAMSPVTNDISGGGLFNASGFDLSSIEVDPHDATGGTVYATVMGFAGNGLPASHVYRSTDAGAHWLNISSNLPNAPANSVIVDPNDANTLYVAMDTGVYVTTQVGSCTTSSCWSVYGTGLPNAPAVKLAAAAQMSTGDGRTGELRVATYGRGLWQIPLLTAAFPAQPAMSVSPSSLTFSAQGVGTLSAAQTVTVTNTGLAGLRVSQVAATGDFSAATTCTGLILAPGSGCAVTVQFQPGGVGNRAGLLTVYGNVPGGQATVNLAGTGTPPAAVLLNPVATSFGSTPLGATSAVRNVTISNTGGTALGLQSIGVSGDFLITVNTCGTTLAPSTGCTVAVAFRPTVSGARGGVLTVKDDVGVQTTTLSGTGVTPATDSLTPSSLTFGAQELTTGSGAQTVTLTNAGDVALTLIQAQITRGDFSVVNSCGNVLAAHASCSMLVSFQPTSLGIGSGVLMVSDQYRSQSIALAGTGIAPPGVSLAPTGTLSFQAVGVGLSSVPQTATITNNGGLPLHVSQVEVSGDFAVASGGCVAGMVVAVGGTCTMQVIFSPTVAGVRTGVLRVSDDALTSPQTMQLTGIGVDFALTADGSTTVTAASGTSAVFPLLLSSPVGVTGVANLTCSGLPANATCAINPSAAMALGNTARVSVTILTGVTASAAVRGNDGTRLGGAGRSWPWLALLFPVGVYGFRRREEKLPRLIAMSLLLCLLVPIGCGATRRIPADGSSGGATVAGPATPSGTYGITVSAASAGLVRSIQLTLVVP